MMADVVSPELQKEAFSLLENSLSKVIWGYEQKSGEDREIAFRSEILAKDAYVTAALLDRKRASDTWEKATGKPPSIKMEGMVDAAEREAGKNGNQFVSSKLSDLSAGFKDLVGRRQEIENKSRAVTARNQLQQFTVALGDATERRLNHRRRGTQELLSPEQNRDDSGLHLLRSVMAGMRASADFRQARREAGKEKLLKQNLVEARKELGQATSDPKSFSIKGERIPGISLSLSRAIPGLNKAKSNAAPSMGAQMGQAVKEGAADMASVVAGPDLEAGKTAPARTPSISAQQAMHNLRQMGQGINR